ncbi:MAG: hypothetical protein WBI17_08830 [Clostridiaceae bacterium]
MPYELGGRADKSGNRYEIRVVVNFLLNVFEEKNDYLILEALGDDEQGIDILVGHNNGSKEGIQCKGRNGSKNFWDFGTANAKAIFSNWKFHLDRDSSNQVSLASPLHFTLLEDLINRSKNTSDLPLDFYNHQVSSSSKEFIKFFSNFCSALSIDPLIENDLARCIDYLKRIHCRQFPDSQLKDIVLDRIRYLFLDDATVVYDRLIAWIIDGDILGKKITSAYISDFIRKSDLKLKNLAFDQRLIPKLNELNQEFKEAFISLDGGLLDREEFFSCRAALESGRSLLIHGKAGCGKSGCTEDIINYCDENNIQYVGIKLDKRIPSGNAERWGQKLGLPTSIAHCIHSVTKDDRAVIILDQLDALRWTQSNSSDSLLVCSEIIKQVSRLNIEREHNISIVFVCRTYDIENDNNIKSLFEVKEQGNEIVKWEKILIGELSDHQVKNIIGMGYEYLSKKLKALLRIPSNLYIWQHLESGSETNECSTTSHLVSNWWSQLVRKFVEGGFAETDIQNTKKNIIEQFDKLGRLYVPASLLANSITVLNFLNSNGFLVIQEEKISFVHQSVLDCFLAEKMLNQYYSAKDITEIIGVKEKQTPGKRYQLQMLMQNLLEIESQDFINAGLKLLNSDSIRYYNKYVFFEVLNQIENVDSVLREFVLEHCEDPMWGNHLINTVVQSKPQYFGILRNSGVIDIWLNNPQKRALAINLFVSIRPNYELQDIELIEKYAFQSEEAAREFSYCFLYGISDDTDAMFELRMSLYTKFPVLADAYIDFKSLLKNCEIRAIRYFAFLLEHKIKNQERSIYQNEIDFLDETSEVMIENGLEVIELLLPFVPKESAEIHDFSNWSATNHHETLERVCINILKKVNRAIISTNPKNYLDYYESWMGMGNDIFNELILDALFWFPEELSDFVITYMYNNFERDIFDRTSGNSDELYLAKLVLEKHSRYCSESVFNKLVSEIVSFTSSEAVDIYRRRIEYNKGHADTVYWSFWGDLQFELLSVLPFDRLDFRVQDFIKVLGRKFNKETSMYKRYNGHGGWVTSPISGKNLTSNNWLRIITNRKLEQRSKRKWKEVPGGFIESTIEEFSNSFRDAVSKEPKKMMTLVLNTNEHIEDTYIDSLFSGVAHSEFLNEVPTLLIEKMIINYPCDSDSYRGSSLCIIIEKSENVEWSLKILDIIKEIAINHNNPAGDKPNVTSQKDDNMRSYDMLFSNAINCVRGRAAQAIGHILWKSKTSFAYFKETIKQLSADVNPAVKLASLFALWPSYNIEKGWASEGILALFEKDYRLAGFHETKNMLFLLYPKYRERVLEIIKQCYYSDDEDLVKMGSYSLAEMYILKNEFIDEMSRVSEMSKEQAESILFMTMLYFKKDDYNSLAKDIICRFKPSNIDLEMPISRLFYDDLIYLDRDKDFLIDIMSSVISQSTLHAFIHYLEEESKSLIDFSAIIISMSNHLIENLPKGKLRDYGIDDSLSKLVIGLYDETSGSSQANMKDITNTCLDLWDKMFEYQVGSARRLSQELMER